MYDDLKHQLDARMPHLKGSWVAAKSSYERDLCAALLFTEEPRKRYWDASWHGYFVELKKGTSIWLDLVRYSEMLLKHDEEASQETVTLFLIPDPKARHERIGEVICVPTGRILEKLGLTREKAGFVLELSRGVPRALNAQARLTVVDVRSLCSFAVTSGGDCHKPAS